MRTTTTSLARTATSLLQQQNQQQGSGALSSAASSLFDTSDDTGNSGGKLSVKAIAIAGAVLLVSVGGFLLYRKLSTPTPGDEPDEHEDQTEKQDWAAVATEEEEEKVVRYSNDTLLFDTTKWLVYSDESLGIQFKYPLSYQVNATTNEDGSYALHITDKNDKTNNAQILIHIEDQDEQIPADLFLQSAIHELSLAGSMVQTRNEKQVTLSSDQCHGKELEMMVTVSSNSDSSREAIGMWVLVTTLLTKAITVQYTCTDMALFDATMAKEIVKTLKIDREKQQSDERVVVRVHVTKTNRKKHQVSINLPNYSFHVRKPYIDSNMVLCAAIASGNQLQKMISIRELALQQHNNGGGGAADENNNSGDEIEWKGDLDQFMRSYMQRWEASIVSDIPTVSLPKISSFASAQFITYVTTVDNVQYKCYDAIFEHESSLFIISAQCLIKKGAGGDDDDVSSWKAEALKTIASVNFDERTDLNRDVITYSNQIHKFTYEINAEYFVKQHAVYPIVTFSIPPSAIDTNIISQTRIAVRDIQSPLSNISVLKDMLIEEIQSAQSTILEVVSDRSVTISGRPAIEIVYRLRDPLTQQVLVFVTTAFVRESTKVFSIQSCVLESVYDEHVYEALKLEHASFHFE